MCLHSVTQPVPSHLSQTVLTWLGCVFGVIVLLKIEMRVLPSASPTPISHHLLLCFTVGIAHAENIISALWVEPVISSDQSTDCHWFNVYSVCVSWLKQFPLLLLFSSCFFAATQPSRPDSHSLF